MNTILYENKFYNISKIKGAYVLLQYKLKMYAMKNNIKVEKNKSVDSIEWDIACKYVYSGNLTCN